MTSRAREAERRVREINEELRVQRERACEAEDDVHLLREKAREVKRDSLPATVRLDSTRKSLDSVAEALRSNSKRGASLRATSVDSLAEAVRGHTERESLDSVAEAVRGDGEREKERLARAMDKVQVGCFCHCSVLRVWRVCMRACKCNHVFVCVFVCVSVPVFVCVFVCVCVCVCVRVCVCEWVYSSKCECVQRAYMAQLMRLLCALILVYSCDRQRAKNVLASSLRCGSWRRRVKRCERARRSASGSYKPRPG